MNQPLGLASHRAKIILTRCQLDRDPAQEPRSTRRINRNRWHSRRHPTCPGGVPAAKRTGRSGRYARCRRGRGAEAADCDRPTIQTRTLWRRVEESLAPKPWSHRFPCLSCVNAIIPLRQFRPCRSGHSQVGRRDWDMPRQVPARGGSALLPPYPWAGSGIAALARRQRDAVEERVAYVNGSVPAPRPPGSPRCVRGHGCRRTRPHSPSIRPPRRIAGARPRPQERPRARIAR